MGKKIVLTDSSLNSYGYRVLTSGGRLDRFKKNPVMLYMHLRDEGSPIWGNYKAIGHWENIEVVDDQILAEPVFDKCDELSKEVAAKFEAGTFRAASIGLRIIATSKDESLLLPGQTRETVTEWELLEASIVDIPANGNAVRLYDSSTVALAAGSDNDVVPALNFNKKMNLKASWKTVLAFLGIREEQAESTELAVEHIESLNGEMGRLQDEKKEMDEKLKSQDSDIEQLKKDLKSSQDEVSALKSASEDKDKEIAQLKEQVNNLKAQPDDEPTLNPKSELNAEQDDFATFCDKTDSTDYAAFTARMKEEGLI